jgi:hypothetical protein
MVDKLIGSGIQYSCYLVEVALLIALVRRHGAKLITSVGLYLALLLTAGATRSYFLYGYGYQSRQYTYCYYLTDFLLTLTAVLLVCTFFHRACLREEKIWRFIRLLLAFVFVIVVGISWFSLSRDYKQIITWFMVEFEQNIYFTCLVLTTLLYLLMQQIGNTDEELELLVCGMGIQFAGPAASWALVTLTPGAKYSESLRTFILPLCTLGMLLTWLYAVALMPKGEAVSPAEEKISDLQEAIVFKS